MNTETYILPAYWASTLINNDNSGLTDAEENEINKFVVTHREEDCMFNCIDCSNESYFASRNDANSMGGDVMEFTFDVTPINQL